MVSILLYHRTISIVSLDVDRVSQNGIHIGAVVWLQVPRHDIVKHRERVIRASAGVEAEESYSA
jgi:hypothetical protein